MKDILSFLTEVKPSILEEKLSDNELVEIYNSTTGEEANGYNIAIQLFLDNKHVPIGDLRVAVSFFYMKLHLLENNLIKNEP